MMGNETVRRGKVVVFNDKVPPDGYTAFVVDALLEAGASGAIVTEIDTQWGQAPKRPEGGVKKKIPIPNIPSKPS